MAPQHAEGTDEMRKFMIVTATILVATGLAGCDRHNQSKEATVQVVQAPTPDCNCASATDHTQSEEKLTRLPPSRSARHHRKPAYRQTRHRVAERYAANYTYSRERNYDAAYRGHYLPPPPPPHRFHERSYDGRYDAYANRRPRVWVDGFGKRHFLTAGYSRATRNAARASINSADANAPWAHYDEDCDH